MQPMLSQSDVRDQGSAAPSADTEAARRVLEGPEQDVQLKYCSRAEERVILDAEGGPRLRYGLLKYGEMRYSQRAALARLDGAGPQRLAGGVVLLAFDEKPVWHPKPGLTDVLLAVVHENPYALTQQDVFFEVHEHLKS